MRLLLAMLAALVVVPSSAAVEPSGRVLEDGFVSASLGGSPLAFQVYLPPSYDVSPARRYPVVYVLHGLPADGTGYLNTTWLPPVLDLLPREAIAVFPQGSTATDSDPEYHDWGPTRDWETALARELPAYVDAHYRTIASRSGRALVGYSAGGYGAMVIGLHHLDEYGAIESWSGYFHATTPDGTASMELGSPSADAYANLHTLVPRLRAELARRPTFLGFYIGASDPLFVPENRQFDAELRRARVRHVFEVYAGGHDPTLWTAHAAAWLAMALRRLR